MEKYDTFGIVHRYKIKNIDQESLISRNVKIFQESMSNQDMQDQAWYSYCVIILIFDIVVYLYWSFLHFAIGCICYNFYICYVCPWERMQYFALFAVWYSCSICVILPFVIFVMFVSSFLYFDIFAIFASFFFALIDLQYLLCLSFFYIFAIFAMDRSIRFRLALDNSKNAKETDDCMKTCSGFDSVFQFVRRDIF